MSKLKFTKFPMNLKSTQTYLVDSSPDSDYFHIKEFPSILTAGKNYFLISGTSKLKPQTKLAVEVVDENNNVIYSEIPDVLINGTDRIIKIYIYDDTIPGIATVTVLGVLSDAPSEWENKYNVKWQRTVNVNPTINDTKPPVFIQNPVISIHELYDISGSVVKTGYSQKIYNSGSIIGTLYGNPKRVQTQYSIQLESPYSFTKDMIGGIIYVSGSDITVIGGSYSYTPTNYSSEVVNVLNSNTIVVKDSYKLLNRETMIYDVVKFSSPTYSLEYSKIETLISSSNIAKSYLEIDMSHLDTHVGSIQYVDLYKNPGNKFIGRYDILPYDMLNSSGSFTSISSFNNTWTSITSSGFVIDYNDDVLSNSIKLSGTSSYFIQNSNLSLYKDSEYEISFNFVAKDPSPRIDIYITGSSDSAFKKTDSYGYLVTSLIPDKNTHKIFKKNIIADLTGNSKLLIKVYNGEWYISDVKFQPFGTNNFSVSHTQLKVENPATHRNEQITINPVFIGGNNVPVGDTKKTLTNAGYAIPNFIYFPVSSSNLVISHDDNLIEGSLHVGSSVTNSGIYIAGKNGASVIQSIGYPGYNEVMNNNGKPGFIIYSGSAISGSSDNYGGLGLELVSQTGSLRFHVNGPADTFLEVITPNFFLGRYGNQYISGSNGVIEISSSNFFLSSSGDVLFGGTISGSDIYGSSFTGGRIQTSFSSEVNADCIIPTSGSYVVVFVNDVSGFPSSSGTAYIETGYGSSEFHYGETNLEENKFSACWTHGSAISASIGNTICVTSSLGLLTRDGLKTINASIKGSTIEGSTITIGSGSNIFKADNNGIYLGSSSFADAPFSVTPTGTLKTKIGNVGAWTIADLGIYSGRTAYDDDANSGTWIGITGIAIGNTGAPKFTVSSSGQMYVLDGIFTGKINASDISGSNISGSNVFGSTILGGKIKTSDELDTSKDCIIINGDSYTLEFRKSGRSVSSDYVLQLSGDAYAGSPGINFSGDGVIHFENPSTGDNCNISSNQISISQTGNGNAIIAYSSITSTGDTTAITGISTTTSGTAYGLSGQAIGSDQNVGVYGYAAGGITNWSGYFVGSAVLIQKYLRIGGFSNETSSAYGIKFGVSEDTNLYRSGSNILRTDDAFDCDTLKINHVQQYISYDIYNSTTEANLTDGSSAAASKIWNQTSGQSCKIRTFYKHRTGNLKMNMFANLGGIGAGCISVMYLSVSGLPNSSTSYTTIGSEYSSVTSSVDISGLTNNQVYEVSASLEDSTATVGARFKDVIISVENY
jgi:hypothetical protein